MNLPVLTPIVKNVPLDKIIPEKLFLDLQEKLFDGYIYLTIDGKYCFEESIIILAKGKIEGAIYLIEGYDIELLGRDAIKYCFNCFGAKRGRLNLFTLTDDQIKLVLIFNERLKYSLTIKNKNTQAVLKNLKYNEAMIDNLLQNKIITEKSSKEILDEFNLVDLLRE